MLWVKGVTISNKQIASGMMDMKINCPQVAKTAKPGQFVNVLCSGGQAFLRRPISICDCKDNVLRIIYEIKGKGTALLAKYEAGSEVDMLAPLGNGFTVSPIHKNPIIIGGGIGVYPLLMLAKKLNNPHIFLGFRDESRVTLHEEFGRIGTTYLCTDDGSCGIHGFATDEAEKIITQNQSEIIYACGPAPMLKAVVALANKHGIASQISMEERMGCGIGACLVCACKTKKGENWEYSHVCSDGPVFKGECVVFE